MSGLIYLSTSFASLRLYLLTFPLLPFPLLQIEIILDHVYAIPSELIDSLGSISTVPLFARPGPVLRTSLVRWSPVARIDFSLGNSLLLLCDTGGFFVVGGELALVGLGVLLLLVLHGVGVGFRGGDAGGLVVLALLLLLHLLLLRGAEVLLLLRDELVVLSALALLILLVVPLADFRLLFRLHDFHFRYSHQESLAQAYRMMADLLLLQSMP